MEKRGALLRLALAWLLVDALLMAPVWLAASVGEGQPTGWIALEAALVVSVLALLPRRTFTVAAAWGAAFLTVLAAVLALADAVFRISLGRPLNVFLDAYLASAVWLLAVGNLGLARTSVSVLVIVALLAILIVVLARLLAPPDAPGAKDARMAVAWGLIGVSMLGFMLESQLPVQSRVATPVIQLVREQTVQFRDTRRERERFAAELESAPDSYADLPGLLGGLADRDVLLTFIESYGMAALEDPQFAAVVGPRLDTLAARVAGAGLHMATGVFASPTQGGQSWLAHGTAISGLWLDSQLRYELMIASDRETLVDDFRAAGHRTVALMPAITTAWPEGVRLGYDRILTRPDIPYEGPPLYWVSMPDQYTLSFVERDLLPELLGDLDPSADRPLFAEIALVSSHAPWTPILPIVPWDSVGDGSVFAPYEQEGHPPEELWVDPDLLREAYPRSIDYSLEALTAFAERNVEGRTLLIALGDHQAAPWVTGASSSNVPVHVFTGDAALLEPFLEWGFREGAFPDPGREPRRMDELRGWLVRAFSSPVRTGPS